MRGNAPGRLATRLEEGCRRGVRMRGDRRRNAGERRLEHLVVGEGEAAQHLCLLELAPGVDEIDRPCAGHLLGELDREVNAGDRSAAGERDGARRKAAQPALDQVMDARRLRQALAQAARAGRDKVLDRLEREQWVAAGVPEQARRELGGVILLGQAERIDQLVHRLGVERAEGDELDAVRFLERRRKRLDRRVALGRPLREAPA